MTDRKQPNRRRAPLSLSRRSEIAAKLRDTELSQAEIATLFDVDPMTVNRIAVKHGVSRGKTTAQTPLSFRVAPDELATFDDAWKRNSAAKSRNEALRRLVRQAGEVLDADPATLDEWREIARQLRGAATNLNQMARQANRGELNWGEDERREIAAFAKGVGALSRKFSNAVSVASRKSKSVRLIGERDG